MPKKKAEAKEYVIYLIVSPIDPKKIYINKTYPHRLRKAYTEHIKLRVTKTKDMCSKAAEQHILPPLYVLETALMPPREAFRRCVAWTRYFSDYGYTQITEDILTEYAMDLIPAAEAYYERIKATPIDTILSHENRACINYKLAESHGSNNSRHSVSFTVTKEQHQALVEAARKENISLNKYVIKQVLNGQTIHLDFNYISDYLDEYAPSKLLLKQILFSVYTTGKYYPADIRNIQQSVDRLCQIEKKVSNKIKEALHALED